MAVLGTAQTLPSQPIPGQDPIDCMSSLYAIPNCLQEIAQPFVNGEFGTIGHSCCHAFLGLSADCITESKFFFLLPVACMAVLGTAQTLPSQPIPGHDPTDCMSSLYAIPNCLQEIVHSFVNGEFGTIGHSCCHAFLGLSADCITESLEPLLIWYWSKPIKPSTLYCTSPPATADIVPPQLELNLGGRETHLMGIGDGSRAVPLPMSLACSSPVMHVAAKMAFAFMAVLGTAQTLPSQPIPGQDPAECMSSMFVIPTVSQKLSNRLSADCITERFDFTPEDFPLALRDYCSRQ
ncbi:hypothetical protein HID58_007394 [Brassica napus]|uniref:Prolamin-like domain-containing protein n=1 Tax=Brassica napus TaxID=3708 RepID=A0ABQ8EEU1_BRANA|nr:hypothetical protein HID58_007394 [Brassica napus]